MQISKKMIPAVLCAGMLLLTACAKDTDLSARYPDFMKYSFGDGYTMNAYESERASSAYDCYTITYQQPDGTRHTLKETDSIFLRYDERMERDKDMPETAYYDRELARLVNSAIADAVGEELAERVLKPYFPDEMEKSVTAYYLKDAQIQVVIQPVAELAPAQAEYMPMVQSWYQTGTGFQVCKADMKSIACDERWSVFVWCIVNEGVDPEPYVNGMQAAYRDYLALTENPQNYLFLADQHGKEDMLFRKGAVLGEEDNMGDVTVRARDRVWEKFRSSTQK